MTHLFLKLTFILISCNLIFSQENKTSGHQNDPNNKEVIRFDEIEVIPFFKDCISEIENCEKRNCVDQFVLDFIKTKVDEILKEQNQYMSLVLRTNISFEIGIDGRITNVKNQGKDAKDTVFINSIVALLPTMIPGEHLGKKVKVLYQLPIVFGNWPHTKVKEQKKGVFVSKDFGQNGLDHSSEKCVIFPGCDKRKNKTNAQYKKCMSEKIIGFVDRHYNSKLGKELNLFGINKVYVRFTVSACGNVKSVEARGPHPVLEKEAVRVLKMLPKMQPGMIDDNAVSVDFSLPIVLTIVDNETIKF